MTESPDAESQLIEAAAVAAAAAVALSEQIEDVQADRRRDKRVYVAMLATILACALLVVGGGAWYVVDSRHRSTEASADRASAAAVLARVEVLAARIDDCISSTGDCYRERTESRYGDPSGPVNTVIVLAAACAQEVEGDDAILACVRRKLEQHSP